MAEIRNRGIGHLAAVAISPASPAPESPTGLRLTLKSTLRSYLLPRIDIESTWIAKAQAGCPPWMLGSLNLFGLLGTHAAFMLFLPPLFWLGDANHEFGRGFVITLLFGVWLSAAIKDYLCLPRPLSPPVVRLSKTPSIALEYGFPSTHTMNAATISLYTAIHLIDSSSIVSPEMRLPCLILLGLYSLIMGFSRVMTGMHSLLDVFGGAWLGVGVVLIWCWGGVASMTEALIASDYGNLPIMTLLFIIMSIYIHPVPDQECPCFEDSVASISVVGGVIVGAWHYAKGGVGNPPPAHLVFGVLRMVIGICVVYGVRKASKLVCKSVLSRILGDDAHDHQRHKENGVTLRKITVKTLTDGVVYGLIGFVAVDTLPTLFSVLHI